MPAGFPNATRCNSIEAHPAIAGRRICRCRRSRLDRCNGDDKVHIPDGYLSPIFSIGLGVVTVPTWVVATRRVQQVLNHRTVPLLAIFAALCFTIMMFNVPVPGGTTAHGVGGTLVAIVLGPSAAVIVGQHRADHPGAVLRRWRHSGHLRQLLQHGDLLPFVGYSTLPPDRRPLAAPLDPSRLGGRHRCLRRHHGRRALRRGRARLSSPSCSTRTGGRCTARTVLAEASRPCCSRTCSAPRSSRRRSPAFGFAYLQQHHPEYLTSLRGCSPPGRDARDGPGHARPLWQLVGGGVVAIAVVLLGAPGWSTGGGDLDTLSAPTGRQVDWLGRGDHARRGRAIAA